MHRRPSANDPIFNPKVGEYKAQFIEVAEQSIDDQAKIFLRAFVIDFKGNFEVVVDLAGEFHKFAEGGKELDEMMAHRFLEKRGETVTVAKLRDWLKEVDLDRNRKISFIEYCLYKWQKTVSQLFAPPPALEKRPSPEALAALDEAITAYQSIVKYKSECEDKMRALNGVIEEGKSTGGKGRIAAADAQKELDTLQGGMQIKLQKDKMKAKGAKRRAQQQVEQSMKDCDPVKREEERLAKLGQDKKDAEAKRKAESKAKLAARAAMFGGK